METIRLSTHNGTHMDAPWHFHSTQDEVLAGGKRPSMTIDELPLDWCLRPGVKLDFRHFPDGYVAIAGLEILLEPAASGCGIGREGTLRLTSQGVKIVGTDAWSWDAPFVHTNKVWQQTHDPSIIWEGHKAGREIGYFQMEKLHNLEALPSTGFRISCFPVKIKAASAGWIRAVGLID